MRAWGGKSDHMGGTMIRKDLALGTDRDTRMQRRNISRLLAGSLEAVKHICQPALMQRTNISRLWAGSLKAVQHICWLACMQHRNISRLLAGSLKAAKHTCRPACL